ncbi:hypothetical protein QQG09_09075 [Melissococcus plutonius]|uniref:hypothetical protein n=1 Tax=Melissococcus plutonius TaxID=33970 RepID=UPI00065E8D40|nr:hypothetical protein [Melissococcus plutonius]AIM25783.1 hypothetical protein MEPL_c010490 [Melissococcus plutonius S1]KMT23480.1 hypothetical protein MEPL2_43p00620 [Melissococcus plutonius]KMT25238.1 hypothetical protein MEPL2_2c07960 [Melissococcus plutonius]KMT26144.1 hypothetical protein MEPL3_3c00690 [Melissococcus plutonius]KMT26874.1 hypothetical protein MEPL1_4c00690 [Melissococcus plutonius]
MNEQQRIANALESISKSLSSLAEEAKTYREFKKEISCTLNDMEEKLNSVIEDPFVFNVMKQIKK